MFEKQATVAGVTFNRQSVERVLEDLSGGLPGRANFFVPGPKETKIGTCRILSALGVGNHHTYDAVQALLQLGFVVRARQEYPTHSLRPTLAPYLKAGRLLHDSTQAHHKKVAARDNRDELTPEERQAVEARAMAVCKEFFKGWQFDDVSTTEQAKQLVGVHYPGYDVRVKRRSQELHVEVKGTRAYRPVINITANELETASQDSDARLLVVSGIELGKTAAGGVPVLYRWKRHELRRVLPDLYEMAAKHGLRMVSTDWVIDVGSSPLLIPDLNIKHPRA